MLKLAAINGFGADGSDRDLALSIDFCSPQTHPLLVGAFTRATDAVRHNASGDLEVLSSGVARAFANCEYDPATLLPLGYRAEPTSTNRIRNNTMTGAVAGIPGTLPTYMAVSGLGTLTQEVVGTGAEHGIEYVDLHFSGTTSTTALTILLDTAYSAASASQAWSASAYLALPAGALTNVSAVQLVAQAFDSVPALLSAFIDSGDIKATLGSTLSTNSRTRKSGTTPASTASVRSAVYITFASGVAVDFTLRIGLPQLESVGVCTSVIKTSGATATRNYDNYKTSDLSWLNATEGTFITEIKTHYLNVAADVQSRVVWCLGDDTLAFASAKAIYFARDATAGYGRLVALDAGVGQITTVYVTLSEATRHKVAMSYRVNDFAGSFDGAAAVTDLSGTIPAVTKLSIGSANAGWSGAGGNAAFIGTIKSLDYYNVKKSNTEFLSKVSAL